MNRSTNFEIDWQWLDMPHMWIWISTVSVYWIAGRDLRVSLRILVRTWTYACTGHLVLAPPPWRRVVLASLSAMVAAMTVVAHRLRSIAAYLAIPTARDGSNQCVCVCTFKWDNLPLVTGYVDAGARFASYCRGLAGIESYPRLFGLTDSARGGGGGGGGMALIVRGSRRLVRRGRGV